MLEGASTTVQGIPEPLPYHLNTNTNAKSEETVDYVGINK